MKANLLRAISHDLRTPLTMIMGYAEMMRDIPGENSPENLKIIIDEVDRLNVEVNDRCSICIPIDTITCGTLKLSKRCNGKFWNGCFCGTIVSILIFVGCYIIIFTTR